MPICTAWRATRETRDTGTGRLDALPLADLSLPNGSRLPRLFYRASSTLIGGCNHWRQVVIPLDLLLSTPLPAGQKERSRGQDDDSAQHSAEIAIRSLIRHRKLRSWTIEANARCDRVVPAPMWQERDGRRRKMPISKAFSQLEPGQRSEMNDAAAPNTTSKVNARAPPTRMGT